MFRSRHKDGIKWGCVAILACALSLAAEVTLAEESAIPRARAKRMFVLAQRLSDADGGKLWGERLDGPLMFVDRASRTIVANQADAQGELVERDGVWCGQLPEAIQPANTSVEWNGVRWTMVMWNALANSPYESGRLLMHESFHRIQPKLGFKAASPANAHLDGEPGRAWMRLEMRALAEAMLREANERENALRDALLFRTARRRVTSDAAALEEAELETNEGICEYTGLRLSGLPAEAQEQRIAMDLERREASESFSRAFAYATGPALAFALDEHAPMWRSTAATQGGMAAQLAKALDFNSDDEESLLKQARQIAAERYDGEFVFSEERLRAAKRVARLAELEAMFADEQSLLIETGSEFRFSFDPNAAESLDEKRIFYRPLNASDVWGSVEAPEGALVDFNFPMKLRLPIPKGATPQTVAWKLSLKPGFRLDTEKPGAWKIVEDAK